MDYLYNKWNELKENFKKKFLYIFLDYDGTLTPIVKNPKEAIISQETKTLLQQLANSQECKLAIISGRALKDIKKIVSLKNIIYVGNHGFEIEGSKIKFESPGLFNYKGVLKKIKNDLDERLSKFKGVFLEDKGITLAIHYRSADKKDIPLIKKIFHETIFSSRIKKEVEVKRGKMLLEIRPPRNWDKGKVSLWLLAREQFALKNRVIFPVYIGDDVTDEDAFKALRNKGLTVFVGNPAKTTAQYHLRDTQEVLEFLRQIWELQRT
ncbi:MAG: trehalose-phosphatase [Candidatus Omnitrophota bacterium]|nr:trehalose-phosphatase [Candidatus Omnitrophota bacterium]